MKSDQTIIRKSYMEQLNLITNLLRMKDQNIVITDEYGLGTHLELHGYLDYIPPKCVLPAREKWLNTTSRKPLRFPM